MNILVAIVVLLLGSSCGEPQLIGPVPSPTPTPSADPSAMVSGCPSAKSCKLTYYYCHNHRGFEVKCDE